MACESPPPDTAASTVRPRSSPLSSISVRLTSVTRLGGCERAMSASDDLEVLAELQSFDALEVDASVRRSRVAVATALSFGREMRAALTAEAQAKSCCFVAQLLVDAARAH